MRAAAEYRKHAAECRRLAQQMVAPEDKRALEDLAETWEMLERLSDRDPVCRTEPVCAKGESRY
jgi:plasmid stability protein